MTESIRTKQLRALSTGGADHWVTELQGGQVICACGWSAGDLADQTEALDTWQQHAVEQIGNQP